MTTRTAFVFVIWFFVVLITTIENAEKVKWYGNAREAAQHGSILDVFYISSIVLTIYLSYLLIDSGYWWVPVALHQLIIAQIIRGIYNI